MAVNYIHIYTQVRKKLVDFVKNNEAFIEGHDLDHFYKVEEHAHKAMKYENYSQEIQIQVSIACLLHDVDDRKLFPNNKNFENARYLLNNYDPDFVEPIIEAISLVSCSSNGSSDTPKEWMNLVRCCDRLESLGSIGIQRALIYAHQVGNPYYNDDTLKCYNIDELNNIANKKRYQAYQRNKKSTSVIDHFYDKVLHIGKPKNLKTNNPYILEEAEKGTKIVEDFIINFWKALLKDTEVHFI